MQDRCVCKGAELVLEVVAKAQTTSCCTAQPAQLLVTGPGCFTYQSSITLDGTPVGVTVTNFATETNAGCYYATVVDQNGCISTNFDKPARVVVVPCCSQR